MPTPVYPVVFTPEALEQLEALYAYIAQAASPLIAQRYTDAIVTYWRANQSGGKRYLIASARMRI